MDFAIPQKNSYHDRAYDNQGFFCSQNKSRKLEQESEISSSLISNMHRKFYIFQFPNNTIKIWYYFSLSFFVCFVPFFFGVGVLSTIWDPNHPIEEGKNYRSVLRNCIRLWGSRHTTKSLMCIGKGPNLHDVAPMH